MNDSHSWFSAEQPLVGESLSLAQDSTAVQQARATSSCNYPHQQSYKKLQTGTSFWIFHLPTHICARVTAKIFCLSIPLSHKGSPHSSSIFSTMIWSWILHIPETIKFFHTVKNKLECSHEKNSLFKDTFCNWKRNAYRAEQHSSTLLLFWFLR